MERKKNSQRKVELSTTRNIQAGDSETLSCIVKVRKPYYVPEGFKVRSRIDETMFTADCTGRDLRAAENDPNVESVSPSKRMRQIG